LGTPIQGDQGPLKARGPLSAAGGCEQAFGAAGQAPRKTTPYPARAIHKPDTPTVQGSRIAGSTLGNLQSIVADRVYCGPENWLAQTVPITKVRG